MKMDLLPWVWLSTLNKISPKKKKQLIDFFDNAGSVWDASLPELRLAPFLSNKNIDQLFCKEYKKDAEKILKRTIENKIDVVTIQDKDYPEILKHIYDPPIVLYAKGKLKPDECCIGIVGSRKATVYGLEMAENTAFDLSKGGITVISGMARGIDSHAHYGAIKGGGRTIAVLGCGLDIVYPKENIYLMEQIIKNGAVISENIIGTQPLPHNFPARNRIISGMSKGIAVIEAGEKSGSLITADYALEQGRDVFAVPGNINRWNSKGTNNLIKEGAKLVTGSEDIFEELNLCSNINLEYRNIEDSAQSFMLNKLGKDEKKILDILRYEDLHIDTISEKTGISMDIVNSLLIIMELKGLIIQVPGKVFKLKE